MIENQCETSTVTERKNALIWVICILLLCATVINYMDRMTLSIASPRIKKEFDLSNQQYGRIEEAFSYAFASGALLFGFIADRTNVRWLYPAVLFLWSLMGFLTGYAETFTQLLLCRLFLGLFESGHWPCALKTTLRILPPKNRALGNSVLQSGASIGAIITPIVLGLLLTDEAGSWRPAFQIIAAVGVVWVFAWNLSTDSKDFIPDPISKVEDAIHPETAARSAGEDDSLLKALLSVKFFVLIVIVISINACWQLLRVWLPMFLQTGRGYSEKAMLAIIFWYYIATDVGCLSAGYATRRLHLAGLSVHGSRCVAFGICSTMVAAGGLIPWLPAGPGLLVVLMLMAMGSLGVFPCYYSFSQELSPRHQGVVTGALGTIAWVTSAPMHRALGAWADETKSYDVGLALSCGLPLISFFVLTLLWPKNRSVVVQSRPE